MSKYRITSTEPLKRLPRTPVKNHWSRESHRTLEEAQATEVSLFLNLSSDVKPIATRSRRNSEYNQAFIDETSKSLLMRT